MSLLRAWAAPVAVVLLLAAGGVYLFQPGLERLRWALAIAGVLLLLVSLAANAREVGTTLGRRSTRYGLGAGAVALLAVGIVILANVISARHSARWDLTESARHSLSPQTVKILQGLKTPIEAIAFYRPDIPGKQRTEEMLKLYASYSRGQLSWRMEDLDRKPLEARQYGVDNYGGVVLQRAVKGRDPRFERVTDAEEEKLTTGLIKLTRDAKRVLYVLKGHGEADIANTDRTGLSQAKTELEKSNYEVKELVLARDPKVPDDAGIVLVAGPRTDLLPPELDALDAYIARGGKVFVMLVPFQADGFAKHLARYGVEAGDDLVIETNPIGQIFGVGPEVPVINQYENHPITRDLANTMTFFPVTRSLEPAKAAPKGAVVQALARTSAQSWGEHDRAALQRGEVQFDAGDKKGPLPVALAATIDTTAVVPAADGKGDAGKAATPAAAPGAEEKKAGKARLVVLGTSSIVSNRFFAAQGNRDLFLNAVSWLSEEEDLISVRPKETRSVPIILTAAQSQMVFWLPIVVLPGAIAACGIATMIRRRRAA